MVVSKAIYSHVDQRGITDETPSNFTMPQEEEKEAISTPMELLDLVLHFCTDRDLLRDWEDR